MSEPNNKKFAKIIAFVMGVICVGMLAAFTSCTKKEPAGHCECFDVKSHEVLDRGSLTADQCAEVQKELEKVNNYVCRLK